MDAEVKSDDNASVTTLVTGIVNDAQELLKQQFEMLKHEVREDIRKTANAGQMLGTGVGIGVMGGILLALMLVHLLAWAALGLPLWSCYGICGGAMLAIGIGFYFAGVSKFQSFNPLPDKSAEALKENIQWITNPK